ncbi:MAG: ATP-binding protein [Verrucomicrobiales bacterium]
MSTALPAYEKLGAFYLGRVHDLETRATSEQDLLYDSKDLVTHGVVLGMTGSGKTGLCLALLEEAALDGVPAVIIDPKGDIANLMLTFPELRPEDFRPWINEDDARRKGVEPDAFAAGQAELWKNGLAKWGQDGDRIRRLRESTDIAIYTPGSNAGLPVSILSSFECPPAAVLEDTEAFSGRIESTVSSLLALLGIDVDPLQSREHLFLSAVFQTAWLEEKDLDLPALIREMQNPSFDSVGVMPLETFFPEKDRMALAMRLNGLLASPGFSLWLQGEALDIGSMVYGPTGKPKLAIFSIAHLGDSERMFFVSLLLNQMVAWMRGQSGTTSLRALLYMDEIFGYLPPSANPPSKKPMMTLLKQSRAFGLGVLLATQNPVDLDYRALSNMGTWFLGRLQTERDKARVLDGLEGAASGQGSAFNRADMERAISGLGNRVFLMNNVHDDGPTVFETRWVMSYLRGPLTRDQIKGLMEPQRSSVTSKEGAAAKPQAAIPTAKPGHGTMVKPKVDARVEEWFLPLPEGADASTFCYLPKVMRASRVMISDAKLAINFTDESAALAPMDADRGDADWANAEALEEEPATLSRKPVSGVSFLALPKELASGTWFTNRKKEFTDELSRVSKLDLLQSPCTGLVSQPGEDERDFRIRATQKARELRDERVTLLREDYTKKIARETDDVERARVAVEREKEQSRGAKWSAIANAGASLLGALLGGKKKLTATNVRRAASAGGAITKSMGQASDVERAEDKLAAAQEDVAKLEAELAEKISGLERVLDPISESLATVTLKPLKKDITVTAFGIAWVPEAKA